MFDKQYTPIRLKLNKIKAKNKKLSVQRVHLLVIVTQKTKYAITYYAIYWLKGTLEYIYYLCASNKVVPRLIPLG